jgi:hypothetical protein
MYNTATPQADSSALTFFTHFARAGNRDWVLGEVNILL